MDIRKFCFTLLFSFLIAGVCLAADPLNPRQDSIRVYIYQELPLGTGGTDLTSNSIVNWAINMGIDATCRLFPAYEQLDTLSIDITSGEGKSLNSDFLRMYKVHRIEGDTIRAELVPVALDTTQPLSKKWPDYLQKKDKITDPRYYRTYNGLFFTQPKVRALAATPDSFLISYYALAPGLFSNTDSVKVLKEYYQAVIWHAVSTLHRRRHRFDLANYYMNLFATNTARPVERKEIGQE